MNKGIKDNRDLGTFCTGAHLMGNYDGGVTVREEAIPPSGLGVTRGQSFKVVSVDELVQIPLSEEPSENIFGYLNHALDNVQAQSGNVDTSYKLDQLGRALICLAELESRDPDSKTKHGLDVYQEKITEKLVGFYPSDI